MSKNLVIFIIVLLIGGTFFIFNSTNKSKSKPQDLTSNTVETKKVNTDVADVKNSDSKRVLFFFANWCPTCKVADESLKDNAAKIPENIEIVKVNYNDSETNDEDRALARKYGITYQHTFVQVDENGNEITKWNGGGFEELLSNIK